MSLFIGIDRMPQQSDLHTQFFDALIEEHSGLPKGWDILEETIETAQPTFTADVRNKTHIIKVTIEDHFSVTHVIQEDDEYMLIEQVFYENPKSAAQHVAKADINK